MKRCLVNEVERKEKQVMEEPAVNLLPNDWLTISPKVSELKVTMVNTKGETHVVPVFLDQPDEVFLTTMRCHEETQHRLKEYDAFLEMGFLARLKWALFKRGQTCLKPHSQTG